MRPTPPIPRACAEAVTSGTAYSAFVGYDVAVCAKTGTAQHGSGGSDNASFVLYAPADDPEIAIAIYVEKGAQGGTLGTIARDILTAYFSEGRLHGYRPRRKYPELKSRRAARRPAFRLWRALPNCHCEGASRPWQSREGTVSPYTPL